MPADLMLIGNSTEMEVAHTSDLQGHDEERPNSVRSFDIDSLATLGLDALRKRWTSAYGVEPLSRLSRELLIRGIAYRMQEQARGGLSRKLLRRLEELSHSEHSSRSSKSSSAVHVGTRLIREWQGKLQEVTVLEAGFLWNGKTYESLSEIARLITGTRWSGPRFFGLVKQGKGGSNPDG